MRKIKVLVAWLLWVVAFIALFLPITAFRYRMNIRESFSDYISGFSKLAE